MQLKIKVFFVIKKRKLFVIIFCILSYPYILYIYLLTLTIQIVSLYYWIDIMVIIYAGCVYKKVNLYIIVGMTSNYLFYFFVSGKLKNSQTINAISQALKNKKI